MKTDHKPLSGLQKKGDSIENQRLRTYLTMVLATTEFSFNLEFLAGKKNVLANYGTRDNPLELNNLLPFHSFEVIQFPNIEK